MIRNSVVVVFIITVSAMCGNLEAQDKKKRTGMVTGELKARGEKGKDMRIEILAPGEGKARPYWVARDPAKLRAAVEAAKIGDRVQADWFDSGEGLVITTFQVLKKEVKDKNDL